MKDRTTQAPVETPTFSPDAQAAERVLKALAKLVSGRKIYAENNPRLVQFRDELATTLREFFALQDELVLTIEQFAMHWQEHVVYDNPRRDESLAFILYKDGIGELTILPPAIGDETDRLVHILADELHHVSPDEDVVTRFWNADFQHITYRVLDDYLEPERDPRNSTDQPALEETADHDELIPSLADKGRIVVQRSDALVSLDRMLRDISRRHHPNAGEDDAELAYQKLLRATFSVPAEELEMARGELGAERGEDGIASFFEAIQVFLLLPDNPTGVRDIASVLERLVEFAVTERRPATLERLVHAIHRQTGRADLPDVARRTAEKLLSRCASSDLVASFVDGFAEADVATDAVLAYANAVGLPAIEPLVRALHRGGSPSLHRRICDTLIAISPERAIQLIDRLDVDQPEVAVDAVYLARTLKLAALSPRLRELVFYPDARVKLEMLGWISAHEDADTTNLLLASLGDLDRRVRLRVLEALCDRRDPRVRERITEIAFAKDLGERNADEQEAIFKTLGHVGDATTVIPLRALVEKRRLLAASKGPDVKLLAIRALERIRDRGALDLLAKLCADPSDAVKQRAQRAHQALTAALAEAKAAVETR
ncbi:MAG TPA: HEAT repeat domain-containing protein [Candidatus Krumholzibacteria bacterium]